MTNKPDSAILCYQKALSLNPDLVDLSPVYKQYILKTGRTNESLLFLEQLSKKYPKNKNLQFLKGALSSANL